MSRIVKVYSSERGTEATEVVVTSTTTWNDIRSRVGLSGSTGANYTGLGRQSRSIYDSTANPLIHPSDETIVIYPKKMKAGVSDELYEDVISAITAVENVKNYLIKALAEDKGVSERSIASEVGIKNCDSFPEDALAAQLGLGK